LGRTNPTQVTSTKKQASSGHSPSWATTTGIDARPAAEAPTAPGEQLPGTEPADQPPAELGGGDEAQRVDREDETVLLGAETEAVLARSRSKRYRRPLPTLARVVRSAKWSSRLRDLRRGR
jgi:hypothetical protein